MNLPFREVLQRAKQRRIETSRYDDRLPVVAAKLYGQYRGLHSPDAPHLGDPDVTLLDASLATPELVEITVSQILEPKLELF